MAILTTFFFVPWWFRPAVLPAQPYVVGFLIIIPIAVALVTWILLGFPGLSAASYDSRRWWIAFASLLLGWSFLSVVWAGHKIDALNAACQLEGVMLFTLVVTCAGPSPRRITVTLAMGLIFYGVIAIAQTQLQHSVGLSAFGEIAISPDRANLSTLIAGDERWLRPYGMTVHPNILGGFFAVALLATIGWLSDHGLEQWRYILRFGVAALGLWGLCLTFSRSAWGGFVVGLIAVTLWWWQLRIVQISRRRLTVIAVIGAMLIGAFGLTYPQFVAARTGTGDESHELRSVSDRGVFLNITEQIVIQHPVLGIGMGNFSLVADDIIKSGPYKGWMTGDNVHNIHLLALGELGVVGFALWLLVWGAGFAAAIRTVRDPFAIALIGGTIALLAIGMLDHYPWSIFHLALLMWASLGIALNPQHTCDKAKYS
jgi:O-antigen ligase